MPSIQQDEGLIKGIARDTVAVLHGENLVIKKAYPEDLARWSGKVWHAAPESVNGIAH